MLRVDHRIPENLSLRQGLFDSLLDLGQRHSRNGNRVNHGKRQLAAVADRVNDRAAAYVCENFACKAPVSNPDALDAELQRLSAPRRIIG